MRCIRCPDGPRRRKMTPSDTGELMVMLFDRGLGSGASYVHPKVKNAVSKPYNPLITFWPCPLFNCTGFDLQSSTQAQFPSLQIPGGGA